MSVTAKSESAGKVVQPWTFGLSLVNLLRLTLFGTLLALTNYTVKIPVQVPGHSSVQWMGILLLGKGLIPRFGAGLVIGTVSGVLAIFLGLGKEGAMGFFNYFLPGLVVDLLALPVSKWLDHPVVAAALGIFASLAKLGSAVAVALLLSIPMAFFTKGIWVVVGFHVLFGALGGLLAVVLVKRLRPRLLNLDG